jgi:hypothetical protein
MQSSCKCVAFSTGLMIEQDRILLSSISNKPVDASFVTVFVPVGEGEGEGGSKREGERRERRLPARYLWSNKFSHILQIQILILMTGTQKLGSPPYLRAR